MTSFVFETVRPYQNNSYKRICLDARVDEGSWITFCETPLSIGEESFKPGEFIEMFDHKINKVC